MEGGRFDDMLNNIHRYWSRYTWYQNIIACVMDHLCKHMYDKIISYSMKHIRCPATIHPPSGVKKRAEKKGTGGVPLRILDLKRPMALKHGCQQKSEDCWGVSWACQNLGELYYVWKKCCEYLKTANYAKIMALWVLLVAWNVFQTVGMNEHRETASYL